MNTVAELLRAEDPRYRDRLEETDPQNRHSTRRIEVHQLEYVDSTLKWYRIFEIVAPFEEKFEKSWSDANVGHHGKTQEEHETADRDGELLPMGTKKFRPVVNDSSDEGFNDTEFAIDAQYLSEKMENHVVFVVFSDKLLIYDPLLIDRTTQQRLP